MNYNLLDIWRNLPECRKQILLNCLRKGINAGYSGKIRRVVFFASDLTLGARVCKGANVGKNEQCFSKRARSRFLKF